MEPGSYGKAVDSCSLYFASKLNEVSESANVIVFIKAGSHEATYRTNAAKRMEKELPLHEIKLNLVTRKAEHSVFENTVLVKHEPDIEQEEVPDVIGEIIFSTKK